MDLLFFSAVFTESEESLHEAVVVDALVKVKRKDMYSILHHSWNMNVKRDLLLLIVLT